jgi:hypothetical protein
MGEVEYKNMMTYFDKKEKGYIDYFIYKTAENYRCLFNKKYLVLYNDKTIKYWSLK